MVDPISLGLAGIGAANSALSMVSRFVDVRDETKVLALKSELIGLLVEAQTAQLTLVEEKRQLSERVRELETWASEKDRYEPQTVGRDAAICFGLKEPPKGSEPDHKLCANCFEHGLKRYLQPHAVASRSTVIACHECGEQILMTGVADTLSTPRPRGGPSGR